MPRDTQFIADELRRLERRAGHEYLRGVCAGQRLMREAAAQVVDDRGPRAVAAEIRALPILDLDGAHGG